MIAKMRMRAVCLRRWINRQACCDRPCGTVPPQKGYSDTCYHVDESRGLMLREISQAQKDKCQMVPFIEGTQKSQTHEGRKQNGVPKTLNSDTWDLFIQPISIYQKYKHDQTPFSFPSCSLSLLLEDVPHYSQKPPPTQPLPALTLLLYLSLSVSYLISPQTLFSSCLCPPQALCTCCSQTLKCYSQPSSPRPLLNPLLISPSYTFLPWSAFLSLSLPTLLMFSPHPFPRLCSTDQSYNLYFLCYSFVNVCLSAKIIQHSHSIYLVYIPF